VSAERVPADPDAQIGLYRRLLAGKRILVLLDNAHGPDQARPLLPGAPGCLTLVTSRNQLTGLVAIDGAYPLPLDLLSPDEARQLLTNRIGHDRVSAEPEAVDRLIKLCERLPLALAIAAARAAIDPQLSLTTLTAELGNTRDRLDALTSDDPVTDIRAVFACSYRALAPAAARLFRLLGLHPGPDISTAAAASLARIPPEQVRPLLDELTQVHLIREETPGRYALHDLLRAYAADLAQHIDPEQQRRTATHRMLDHYLRTAHTADRLLDRARDPFTLAEPEPGVTTEHLADSQQALAWFTTEHAALLAAVDHAAATGFDAHAWQLAWTLATFLNRQGYWRDQAAVHHSAILAARRMAHPTAQARAHRVLALAYLRLGDIDDANTQLQHALDLCAQAGDLAGQGHIHLNLATVSGRRGHHTDALHHAQQACDLFRTAGHQQGLARALNAVGWYHAQLGDHQQALTNCEQALDLLRELDDRQATAGTWDSIGYAHHRLGHHAEAITGYQHALNLYRDLGDRYPEATTLIKLGEAHRVAGNDHAARDAWQQALAILTDLDHPDADTVRIKLDHSYAKATA
jgi:tetratricopeptide (TPR) repeat protein